VAVDVARLRSGDLGLAVRGLLVAVVLIGGVFTATTIPGVRDQPGFWVPVDGWLQGTGYALMALLIVMRAVLVQQTRGLWCLLAAAVTLRALGYIVFFSYVRLLVPQPYPSVSDIFWVGASVLFVVAIALRARRRSNGLSRLLLLDGIVGALTIGGLAVALLYETLMTLTGTGVPARAVAFNLTYPLLDVVALVLIAGLLASGWRPTRVEGLIVAGIAIFAVVESVYLYELAAGLFRPGTPLSALSYVGTLVVVIAAWLPPAEVERRDTSPMRALPPRPGLVVPAVLSGICLATLLVLPYSSRPPPLALALLVLALAVTIVRGVLTVFQDRQEAGDVIASRTDEILRFQALVEASSDFIAIAGIDGLVTFVNPAGRELIGLAPDRDVTTTTIADYLTEEGQRASLEVEQPAVVAHGHWEGESTLVNLRGGPPIPVAISSFLMFHPVTGAPFALATVQRDISERIAAEAAVRRLAEQRQELLGRLVQAQEDERNRIAVDVHDDSVQALAAVELRLGLLRRQLADIDPTLLQSVERAHQSVTDATSRLRHLLFDLESPALRSTLAEALTEAADFVFEDTGVHWLVTGDTSVDLPQATRVLAYRVAKEALVNVRKHARASTVEIALANHEGGVLVTVTDDGVGVDTDTLQDRPGHLGLAAMHDRASIAGGRLHLESAPGQGTELRLWVPLHHDSLASGTPSYATEREDTP
jgi:PAS domain S-box-containing protein